MSLEASLNELIVRLSDNKRFPKYQFERSAEIFLSLFIEEFLSLHLGTEVQYVAAEFGIKKEKNNQTTNVDYLLLQKGADPTWIFTEIKTDENSVKPKPFERYIDAQKKGMPALLKDLEQVKKASSFPGKYDFLIERIKNASDEVNLPIRIFCISLQPVSSNIKSKYPSISWLEMSNLVNEITDSKHPELWVITKKLISLV